MTWIARSAAALACFAFIACGGPAYYGDAARARGQLGLLPTDMPARSGRHGSDLLGTFRARISPKQPSVAALPF